MSHDLQRWCATSSLLALAVGLCVGASACGSGGDAGPQGSAATSDAAGLPGPATTTGCDGASLLPLPLDPEVQGPWAVGARTVSLPGLTTATTLRAEIWYPAQPGSHAGKVKVAYDIREHLSADDAAKLKDADNPLQGCECYRDLPPDKDHGPYPLVLFLHGTAGFRTQTLSLMTHWASRGFVVVAADHPGLELKAILALQIAFDQADEAAVLVQALRDQPPPFLQGLVDGQRIAVSGHSAGGNALQALGKLDGVRLLIPLAAGGSAGGDGVRTLVLAGEDDQVVPYAKSAEGYDQTPPPKHLIGLKKAGHLAFSDLCLLAADRGGLLAVAQAAGIQVLPLVAKLSQDGCQPGSLDIGRGLTIVGAVTAAALHEQLHCQPAMRERFVASPGRYSEIGEFRGESW